MELGTDEGQDSLTASGSQAHHSLLVWQQNSVESQIWILKLLIEIILENFKSTTPENPDNKEDPKRDIRDRIYMESRKGQDLLSKLGAWDHGRGEKGRGKEGRRAEKNI